MAIVEVPVFGADLEAVTAFYKAVVDLGIGDVGTRELRIRGLPSKLRVSGNSLAVEAAVDARIARDVGDVEIRQQIVGADVDRRLAARRPRKP